MKDENRSLEGWAKIILKDRYGQKKGENKMAKKWIKKDLEAAAEDFNKVMQLDPAIVTGDDTTVGQLEKDIKDIVVNHLEPDDVIAKETVKLIELMGLPLPKKEKKEDKTKTKTKKAATTEVKKSTFGHKVGTQSAEIDEMVVKGATLEAISKKVGVPVGRVRGHIRHLKNDKHVTIREKEGVFKVEA